MRTSLKRFLGTNTVRCYSSSLVGSSAAVPSVLPQYLAETIKTSGPLSIAAYMRQCLTNPEGGYYTQQNPFGASGDFVTSPEISQMFGELVGIWLLTEWISQSRPQRLSIVELGPGKGTLLDDMLRATSKFGDFMKSLEAIHLIEASPKLREVQREKLCGDNLLELDSHKHWRSKSRHGVPIIWHEDIKSLPESLSTPFIIAHEFFDALPIYSFERTEKGWRELQVDLITSPIILPSGSDETKLSPKFCLRIANKPTLHSVALPNSSPRYAQLGTTARIEVSPETLHIAKAIVGLIKAGSSSPSGAALIVDYGPSETIPIDTLRGIRAHKIVSPFENPGSVDLSVDVDFAGIAEQVNKEAGVVVHGPVEQGDWLHRLGIGARATVLSENAKSPSARKRIEEDYERLVSRGGGAMGKVYKIMAITPRNNKVPVGFS